MHRLERHRHTTVAKLSTSDAEHVGAPRREVVQVGDHLRPRGPGVAGIHRECTHHVGGRSNHCGKDQTCHSRTHLGYSRTPVACSQHGNDAGCAHRPDAKCRRLEITKDAGGQTQDRRNPGPSKATRAQPRKCAEAQQRRTDVQRSTEEYVGQRVARQPQDDHDRRRRRDTSDPPTTFAGQQCAQDDDTCGDHRRDEEQQHAAHARHQLHERVHDGIHRPEGVERERPAMECEIAGTHGLSLQHNGGPIRVSGERVACRHVEDRHQDEEAAYGGRWNDQARSTVLPDRAIRRGGSVALQSGRARGQCGPRSGDVHRDEELSCPSGRSRSRSTTPTLPNAAWLYLPCLAILDEC